MFSKPIKKGQMNVSQASAIRVKKEESGKDYSFRVTVDDENIYLACSNDQDINMWVDAISYCAKKVMLSPRRRSSSKPDRCFFLDSPRQDRKDNCTKGNDEEEDVGDGKRAISEEDDNVTELDQNEVEKSIIAPTSTSHDDDEEDDAVEEPLTRSLSIKIISSDGNAIDMPNFNEMVRGLPSSDSYTETEGKSNDQHDSDFEQENYADHETEMEKQDQEEEQVDSSTEDEFPPLEERFQNILVQASDFIIDTEHGVCGTGAYGTVYKATRMSDNKIFALKFFGYAKRDPENINILETEVDVMLKLKGSEVFAQIESFFYDTYEGLVPGKKFIDAYPGASVMKL